MASSPRSYFCSRTSGLNWVFDTFTSAKLKLTSGELTAPVLSALVLVKVASSVKRVRLSAILLVLERGIEVLRGAAENPFLVRGRGHFEAVASELKQLGQRAFMGGGIRAPGDALRSEFGDQITQEAVRGCQALAHGDEIVRRNLEENIFVRRQAPETR